MIIKDFFQVLNKKIVRTLLLTYFPFLFYIIITINCGLKNGLYAYFRPLFITIIINYINSKLKIKKMLVSSFIVVLILLITSISPKTVLIILHLICFVIMII